MARIIAAASIATVCLLACLHAQEAGDRTAKEKDDEVKGDSCTIPMKVFVPFFTKAIEKETAPGSKIREAALQALSSARVQKGTFKLFTTRKAGANTLISEQVTIEPATGSVVIEGTTWEWSITGILGQGVISSKASPPFARFQFHPRFTMRAPQHAGSIVQVRSDETRGRWFWIVYGGGPEQDATKRPKNAPEPGK